MKVTPEFLEPYLYKNKKHTAYHDTVDIANHLKFHFDGYKPIDVNSAIYNRGENPYFAKLIDNRRPSESETIKEYRRMIYKGKTKAPLSKVINSLKKIVKSQDWEINYNKSAKPASIAEGETLYDYCEKNYPFYNSVENWFTSMAIKQDLTDPNGLIAVLPVKYEVEPNEYIKPYSYFICSDNVIDYQEGEYAIIVTDNWAEYKNEKGEVVGKERIIAIINKEEIWEARKINNKNEFAIELKMKLTFKELPVWRAGGQPLAIIDNSRISVSLVDAVLDDLDTAATEVSDLQAEVVQHIYSTMWYYAGQECSSCGGTGFDKVLKEGKQVACPKCEGNGRLKKSPYKDMVVNPQAFGENPIPTPPAGYIIKPTDIVTIQDTRIRNHIKDALSAINMEFLMDVPLAQSGVAKEVDRDELNNFVYGVAYHFVENIIKRVYYFINEYRYSVVIPNQKTRAEMLPVIPVPEKYDLLSENTMGEQLSRAIQGKQDPLIINELTIEYAAKKFSNMPEIRDKIAASKELDPFPTMDNIQKDDGVLAGTILKEDAILSKYILAFVERAIHEHEDFYQKDWVEKMSIVKTYAKEKATESKAAAKVLTNLNDPGSNNPAANNGN